MLSVSLTSGNEKHKSFRNIGLAKKFVRIFTYEYIKPERTFWPTENSSLFTKHNFNFFSEMIRFRMEFSYFQEYEGTGQLPQGPTLHQLPWHTAYPDRELSVFWYLRKSSRLRRKTLIATQMFVNWEPSRFLLASWYQVESQKVFCQFLCLGVRWSLFRDTKKACVVESRDWGCSAQAALFCQLFCSLFTVYHSEKWKVSLGALFFLCRSFSQLKRPQKNWLLGPCQSIAH